MAKDYPFEFTVVSAVYKAEKFLSEFFESILAQTVGFEKIQLVLVDDGSPDRSGEICDRYAEKYPANVKVIHKENAGAAAARTDGLKYALGRYITFTDPDDTLSPEAMENAARFFEENDSRVKIVAIPIHLFGFAEGEHHLNTKFERGERVINVLEAGEEFYPQLSISSTFIKNDIARSISFNPALVIAEDAEAVSRILVDHPYLGVLPSVRYNYRRYETSQVASAKSNPAWYIPYLTHFSLSSMEYAEKRLGYIPRFIQYTVMCDLKWKLTRADVPAFLSLGEQKEMFDLIVRCMSGIDDDIILMQKSLKMDTKLYFLQKKYEKNFSSFSKGGEYFYTGGESIIAAYSEAETLLDYFRELGDSLSLTLRQTVYNFGEEPSGIFIEVGGRRISPSAVSLCSGTVCLGREVSRHLTAEFIIPKAYLKRKNTKIEICTELGGTLIKMKNLVSGIAFPLALTLKDAYLRLGNLILRRNGGALISSPATPIRRLSHYIKLICSLLRGEELGMKKAAFARAILPFFKLLHRKPVWIISDRLNKAGDNGEAFFRYLKNINYKKAKFYFAISECPDYHRLKPLGNIINHSGWGYKMLHLSASKIISSHAEDYVPNPFTTYDAPYLDILKKQDFIFLQHGVIKDDLSGWLNRKNKNIRGFITSAEPEYRSILDTPSYDYTDREVWLTGLPRFDRLYHDEKKYITVMPTWRRYLMDGLDSTNGVWKESAAFSSSCYFRFYNGLLNNKRLLDTAESLGYTLCYMPHPNVITYIDMFDKDERVMFYTINDEYRRVYAESDLVLTDYSSAVFDFAYLRKPVVYTQFDSEEFFSGEHVYTKGYFDYERDGFGEVVYDLDSTVDLLISYMKDGCKLKDKYRRRIDAFFAYSDQNNCKRVLEKTEESNRKF